MSLIHLFISVGFKVAQKLRKRVGVGPANSGGRPYSHVKFAACRDLFGFGSLRGSSLFVFGVNDNYSYESELVRRESCTNIRIRSRVVEHGGFSGPESSCTPKCAMTSLRRESGSPVVSVCM